MIGIRDRFGESGNLRQLIETHGLSAQHIANAAKNAIERRDALKKS
jgi:transketolase C-terminal domain/subunit